MGKKTGFKEYQRNIPDIEQVAERIQHSKEFVLPMAPEQTNEQAARCMDCGVPFCHSGCPLGNKIPDFNDAVYKDEWQRAYEILKSTNNFPEFTGRICPAPCETSCVLGINNDAVSIEYIEKSIIERAFEEGWVEAEKPNKRTGKKIAIIGSGPAGLACADQLNAAGHDVTVFERKDKIGGLLRYGIPDFKLEKNIIDRRLLVMKQGGIKFMTQINVGVDISVEELQSQYDDIVLTGGSTIARDLAIEGRQLNGIHYAMDYLEQNNRRVAGEKISVNEEIKVQGEEVVVIGGGDTGSDCIGTSHRLGAAHITQIEILSKPPADRNKDNPWPNWPMVLRTSSSQKEGCHREWSVLIKKFISADGISLSGIELVHVDWEKDDTGRYQMSEVEGSTQIVACTKVFLAVGFLHPKQDGLLEQMDIELDARGNVMTTNYLTSQDNIYAAGDMRRGQSLVVWAIAEGRECAKVVDEQLIGKKSQLQSSEIGVLTV